MSMRRQTTRMRRPVMDIPPRRAKVTSGRSQLGARKRRKPREGFWPVCRQDASRGSGRGQKRCGWGAGGRGVARRSLDEPRRRGYLVDQNRPQGSAIDKRRRLDGARIDDENDGVVEIVVIPVATDPRRVGRVSVGGRHQTQQDGDEQDNARLLKHAVMIIRVRTVVKRHYAGLPRFVAEEINATSVRACPTWARRWALRRPCRKRG